STRDRSTMPRSFSGCWRTRRWGRPPASRCCARDARWTCRSRLPAQGAHGSAQRTAGDRNAVERIDAPLLLDRHVDSDPAAPPDSAFRQALILDAQCARRQVVQVVPQVDAEGLRQVAWPATEIVDGEVARAFRAADRTAPAHQID